MPTSPVALHYWQKKMEKKRKCCNIYGISCHQLHILTNIFVENKFYCSIMTFLFSFHISSGYLTRFPMCSYTLGIMLLLCMCVCTNRVKEGELGGEQAASLSVVHGLHAQWRGDDVKPWRKCPHLRQSSCACPSRLAAQHHPFKQPSTPCSSARLSSLIRLLWGMGFDTRLDYMPSLSVVTVKPLLLML